MKKHSGQVVNQQLSLLTFFHLHLQWDPTDPNSDPADQFPFGT